MLNTLFSCSLLFSCTTELAPIDVTYTVENTTDLEINIRFYNKLNKSLVSETSTNLEYKGAQLSETIYDIRIKDKSNGLPTSAFKADSVVIIFNKQRFYTCIYNTSLKEFHPSTSRNIFNHDNYDHLEGDHYFFKIIQEDYNKAQDCNGNCK
ncbi:hypothetical protein C1A40_13435 [Tamlana carrageenivorans]|uniref:Uncharacterized protein n=2 Tax=Pseudotamlana carrageenivorans TaxID=2069432 RepID=A0A2I7SKF3_9FLAO|nr:hypothetical protein C1A40_13435 [Tamlana carrageenivorans]